MAQIIGLDIGFYGVRVALYDTTARKLLRLDEVALDQNTDLTAALRDLFGDKEFSRAAVWASLNDRECLVRDMRVPFTNEDQIRQTINFSAEEVIPDDVSNYLLDYRLIDIEEEKTHLMVIAARRKDIAVKLQKLQDARIDPDGLTFSGLALYHLGAQLAQKRDLQEPFLILDVGASTADVIVGDQSCLRFIRSILIQRRAGEAEEPLDQKRLKRLFTEVKRTLWSGGVDGHPEMIWLCGGIVHVPDIADLVSEAFDIPAESLPLEEIVTSDEDDEEPYLGVFAQSVGLALLGAESKGPYSINFRREEFVRQPLILKVRWPVALALLILIGAFFWDGWLQTQRKRGLKEQRNIHLTWEVQQFVDFWGYDNLPTDYEINADRDWLTKEFEQRLGGVDESLTVYPDVLEALQALSERLTKFSGFRLQELEVDPRKVSLRGSFPSKEQLQEFEDEIATQGKEAFRNIEVRSGGSKINEDGSIAFTCDLPLNRGGF